MSNHLSTAIASSHLSNLPGRAIVTARGHHFIVDSPPPLGGPNEEVNPIDILFSALATCGTFVCETAAREMDIPLNAVSVTVAGDFDPRGVCGEAFDPRVQAFRVRIALSGPNEREAESLIEAFKSRCPVYTTLSRSAPIEIEVVFEVQLTQVRKESIKMKRLRCRDAGFDCDHEIQAETIDEILQSAAEHVQSVHGLEVTPELAAQVSDLIQEVED